MKSKVPVSTWWMNRSTGICGTASVQPVLLISMSITRQRVASVHGKHFATAIGAQDHQAREGLRSRLPCLERLKRLAWCKQGQVAAAV